MLLKIVQNWKKSISFNQQIIYDISLQPNTTQHDLDTCNNMGESLIYYTK